ncbi:unnamed protein product, partial [Laminaria digitata]
MATGDAHSAIPHPRVRQARASPHPRGRHQQRHRQPPSTASMANLALLGLGLLLASSGASAFLAPATPHAPCTTAGCSVGAHPAARKARTVATWGGRGRCYHRCPSSRNVNFADFAVGRKRRNQRPLGLGMVMVGSGE